MHLSIRRAVAIAIVMLVPLRCLANMDATPFWDSVAFTAGPFRVEAKAAFPKYQLTELRVWVSGRRVAIPRNMYDHIFNPVLPNIRVSESTDISGSTYMEIPTEVEDASHGGGLVDGGTWVFYFEGNKLSRRTFEPAPHNTRHDDV